MKKKLIMLIVLLFFPVSAAATYNAWNTDNTTVTGLTYLGQTLAPAVHNDSGILRNVVGNLSGQWTGWTWNGSSWIANTSEVAGLTDVGWYAKPAIFSRGTTNVLISGSETTGFFGFTWNGTAWASNSSEVTGLTNIGNVLTPTVFDRNGSLVLISSMYSQGTLTGYTWNGSSWIANSSEVTGLSGTYYNPTSFNKSGTIYLMVLNTAGDVVTFHWLNSSWILDSNFDNGLPNFGAFNPLYSDNAHFSIFDNNGTVTMMAADNGVWYGYTWQDALYTPPAPINLSNTSGNFWINYTWSAGSGNITDSFNVSQNGTWTNGSALTYMNTTTLSPHGWSNISVYAYNSTGQTALNLTPLSSNTQLSNNPITISNISATYVLSLGETLEIHPIATDLDSDPPIFSNNTHANSTFYTNNGTFLWTPTASDSGIYSYYINVTDNNGSTDIYNFAVSVNSQTPGTPLDISAITGNFWVNTTWNVSFNTNTFNISFNNGTWLNGTSANYTNNTLSAHAWSNITVYGYNTTASLLGNSTSLNTQIPNNAPTISSSSISSSSITTAETLTINAINVTDLDSDAITVNVSVLFNLGSTTNYNMTNTANTSNYTYAYTSTTAGSYTVTAFTITDNQSATTTSTVSHAFTITTPVVISSGGGGGSAYVPAPTATAAALRSSLNLSLIGITDGARNISDLNYINKCITESFFVSNECSDAVVSLKSQTNWYTLLGAYLASIVTLFLLELIIKRRRSILDAGIYGTIIIITCLGFQLMGFNFVFLFNYLFDNSLSAFTFMSFAFWGMIGTLILDEIVFKKNEIWMDVVPKVDL